MNNTDSDIHVYHGRSDASCVHLLGLWSVLLCVTFLGTPFAFILAKSGQRLAKSSDEDFSNSKQGRSGIRLCSIGCKLAPVLFAITVAAAMLVWIKLW